MIQVTTKLEGVEELNRRMKAIQVRLIGESAKTVLSQAEDLRDRIRAKAPVGPTGNLKRSPVAKLMPKKLDYPAIAIAGIDRKRAPHAHFIEFGHGGPHPAPAYPFFRPAIDEWRGKAEGNMKKDFKNAVEKPI